MNLSKNAPCPIGGDLATRYASRLQTEQRLGAQAGYGVAQSAVVWCAEKRSGARGCRRLVRVW
jgi:hypothetical protein